MLAVVACGASTSGEQSWRGLELEAPPGWNVFERTPTLLSLTDGEAGAIEDAPPDPGDPGSRTVAAQLTYEPGTRMDDWRELVAQEDGTVETDEAITVGGLPARRLVFSWTTNGIPTREQVVLVPSRSVVMLFQPLPTLGQRDGPEIYLDHADEFAAIVESIEFGAPVDDEARAARQWPSSALASSDAI